MNDLIELKLTTREDAECPYKVRRFKEEDAGEVRNLIVRNFLEVNSKDYGISAMEKLAKDYDVEAFGEAKQKAYFCVFLSFRNFMEKVLEEKL